MKTRAAFMLLLFVCLLALVNLIPAGAQTGGASNNLLSQVTALQSAVTTLQSQVATLQSQVATLQTDDTATQGRVSKLEGNITADDLVGTYAVHAIQNELNGGYGSAEVGSYVYAGTVTLNAGGTGTFSATESGTFLELSRNTLVPFGNPTADNKTATMPVTWSFDPSSGKVTIPGLASIDVAAGGRVIVMSNANPPPTGDRTDVLMIMTRLK